MTRHKVDIEAAVDRNWPYILKHQLYKHDKFANMGDVEKMVYLAHNRQEFPLSDEEIAFFKD
ncbi:MAG: hypothetical protein WCT40_03640 [Candidatus Magasanikbacteria bacterium]|jgi:hypothetical protein